MIRGVVAVKGTRLQRKAGDGQQVLHKVKAETEASSTAACPFHPSSTVFRRELLSVFWCPARDLNNDNKRRGSGGEGDHISYPSVALFSP